jgi:hypothetical protein
MKINLLVLGLGLALNAHAIGVKKFDLLEICQGKETSESQPTDKVSVKLITLKKQGFLITDKGFCAEFLKQQAELQVKESIQALEVEPGPQKSLTCLIEEDEKFKAQDKWKIRFYASHSFTTYFDSDVTFRSTRYNVEIKDYSWAERGSRAYFNPKTWFEPGHNPFQWIDEPTNTFTVSLEKNGHEFFLSAFHPKFLQASDQVKHIRGKIDGVEVDEVAPVNKPFDGYDQVPGESELIGNRNSHKQMNYEFGYNYRFRLLDSKFGSLTYSPGIGVGIMAGQNVSTMISPNEWWEFDEYEDKYRIQGYGGSLTNRLEINNKKERFGIFYENKLGYYQLEHGFLDGSQEYNLKFMANTVGVKLKIFNQKK